MGGGLNSRYRYYTNWGRVERKDPLALYEKTDSCNHFFFKITANCLLFPWHNFSKHASAIYNKYGQVLTNTKRPLLRNFPYSVRQKIWTKKSWYSPPRPLNGLPKFPRPTDEERRIWAVLIFLKLLGKNPAIVLIFRILHNNYSWVGLSKTETLFPIFIVITTSLARSRLWPWLVFLVDAFTYY